METSDVIGSVLTLLIGVGLYFLLFIYTLFFERRPKIDSHDFGHRLWLILIPHFNKTLLHYFLCMGCLVSIIIFYGFRLTTMKPFPHYLFHEVAVLVIIGSISTALNPNVDHQNTGKRRLSYVGFVNLLILFFAMLGSVFCIPGISLSETVGPIVDFIAHAVAFVVTFFGILGNTYDPANKVLTPSGKALIVVAVTSSFISIISSIDSAKQSQKVTSNIAGILNSTEEVKKHTEAAKNNLAEIQKKTEKMLLQLAKGDSAVVTSVADWGSSSVTLIKDRFMKSRSLIFYLKNRIDSADLAKNKFYDSIRDFEKQTNAYIKGYDDKVMSFTEATNRYKNQSISLTNQVDAIVNKLKTDYEEKFRDFAALHLEEKEFRENVMTELLSAKGDSLKVIQLKKLLIKD